MIGSAFRGSRRTGFQFLRSPAFLRSTAARKSRHGAGSAGSIWVGAGQAPGPRAWRSLATRRTSGPALEVRCRRRRTIRHSAPSLLAPAAGRGVPRRSPHPSNQARSNVVLARVDWKARRSVDSSPRKPTNRPPLREVFSSGQVENPSRNRKPAREWPRPRSTAHPGKPSERERLQKQFVKPRVCRSSPRLRTPDRASRHHRDSRG